MRPLRCRVAVLVAVLVVVLALASGCVSLPESGPVLSGPTEASASPEAPSDYHPNGPRPGDSAEAIVAGFLDSLRQTPSTFTVAREFLTDQASDHWTPSKRTIIYADSSLRTRVAGARATVSLGQISELNARGGSAGDPTHGRGLTFDLHLEQVDGQWRIADPPDALVVPRSHFDTRFLRYDLMFFDPSGRVLVPEPVYLPVGSQTPTLLISGLLAGPDPGLRSVERTLLPPGTHLELPVTVTDGVANIALSDAILDTDRVQLDQAMGQLAWTLKQLPGLDQMRVTVDGAPVDRATGASVRSLQGWSSFDPSVASAGGMLYGVRRGVIVAVGDAAVPLSRAFRKLALRSIGVSLDDTDADRTVAAVSANGQELWRARVGGRARPAYRGSDLLRPAFDVYGQVWDIDRTSSGAELVVVRGGRATTIRAPGLTGKHVTAFALSRDGSRLAAIAGRQLVIARISRSESGRPIRMLPAEQVALGDDPNRRLIDVGWSAPTTMAVLSRPEPNVSLVLLPSVDGLFSLGGQTTSVEPLFERSERIVTWPSGGTSTYLRTRGGRMYLVSGTGHWGLVDIDPALDAPTFAG